MSDWNELTVKIDKTVRNAKSYLHHRSANIQDPIESERLKELGDALDAALESVRVESNKWPTAALRADTLMIFADQLDLSQRHIQNLHEYSDYIAVESVVRGLREHIQVMAGPHGPGGAPPIGPVGPGSSSPPVPAGTGCWRKG